MTATQPDLGRDALNYLLATPSDTQPPLTDKQHAAREEILAALSEAGAFCGDCGFQPGETGCADCVRVREMYADAVTPIIDRLRAERDQFADRVDTLTAVCKSNKRAYRILAEDNQRLTAQLAQRDDAIRETANRILQRGPQLAQHRDQALAEGAQLIVAEASSIHLVEPREATGMFRC